MARYLRKTYCVRKCKKNGYREFDHGGILMKEISLLIRLRYGGKDALLDGYMYTEAIERIQMTS